MFHRYLVKVSRNPDNNFGKKVPLTSRAPYKMLLISKERTYRSEVASVDKYLLKHDREGLGSHATTPARVGHVLVGSTWSPLRIQRVRL